VILSSDEILKALAEGLIGIEPRRGLEGRLGPCSVDFRLGRSFIVFERNKHPYLDPRHRATAKGSTRLVRVQRGESFIIHPGELVLATTVERLSVSNSLLARLEGRSSLGRLGIIVHSTASLFHPGWDGHPTMEMGNLGVMPVAVYPLMRVCQFTFERLSAPEERLYGSRGYDKYQGQVGPGPSQIWRELDQELEEEAEYWGRQTTMDLEALVKADQD
jgi:dCTP deaminase